MAYPTGFGAAFYGATIAVCGAEMRTDDIRNLLPRITGHDPLCWRDIVPLLTVADIRWVDAQLEFAGPAMGLPPRKPDLVRR